MPIVARFNEKYDNLNEKDLEINGRLISPVINMGEGHTDDFTRLTNNVFTHHVLDLKTKEVIPTSTIESVEYKIVDFNCDTKLLLNLNDGITILDNSFIVNIEPSRIKFKGNYRHNFKITDNTGLTQYTFDRRLRVT